jgi:hypothetical protein
MMIDPIETYCLGLIVEESAEVGQWVGKALRFGIDTPGQLDVDGQVSCETPRTMMPVELGDLLAAIEFSLLHGVVDRRSVEQARDAKLARLLDPRSRNNLGGPLAPIPSQRRQDG